MFQKNDIVLYGSHGVCIIQDISDLTFGNHSGTYYILKPVYDEKSTIFVPLHNSFLTDKLRHILSETEIHQILSLLPQEPSTWLENIDERKAQYRKTLLGTDRLEIIKLIRSLYLHQKQQNSRGKKLYSADEHMLKEAERLLYDEFAYVLKIDREQVPAYIRNELENNEKTARHNLAVQSE